MKPETEGEAWIRGRLLNSDLQRPALRIEAEPELHRRRVFRFAPSPNGYLHRGHALSALLNSRAAQMASGRFLLRIEDVDLIRTRPEFEAAIYEDLAWLGVSWETPVLRQSERFGAYRAALCELDKMELLYPSFPTRAKIAAQVVAAQSQRAGWPCDLDDVCLYSRQERDWPMSKRRAAIASGRPYVLCLDTERALAGVPPLAWHETDPFGKTPAAVFTAEPGAHGDIIVASKEIPASYHLAVTIDDAFQGVTDVVRGLDLRPATSVHRLLQVLLGLPEPRYFHHRLILDEKSAKLSKSRGSETIRAHRAAGETAAALIAGLGAVPPACAVAETTVGELP